MKPEIIAVSKSHRPLTGETVLNELKRSFPDLECISTGSGGNAFVVRQSSFAGARIDVESKQIRLKASVPQPLAKALDIALLGMISAAKSPTVIRRLRKHLRRRYAG